MNCTKEKQVDDGTVIDSINGVSSEEIIKALLNRQVRDGENLSYAKWILDTYFREYYSYIFGHPDSYQIAYTKKNQSYTVHVPALVKDSLFYYRQKNYPNGYPDNPIEKGIGLSYDDSKRVAILSIKDFHNEVLKSVYKQRFAHEIKNIFDEIIGNQTASLVIDLRNNQGGDVENGVFLMKFLTANPFIMVNEYQKLKRGALTNCKGPSMGYHQPFKKRFEGQIYVLLNGGSFSNTAIFSSCLKKYTNAIFVGTESGGNPNVLAGDAKSWELPNTKIKVDIPTKRFVMTSLANNNGAGLIPAYIVEPGIQDNVHQHDTQLGFLLNLIKTKEQNGK